MDPNQLTTQLTTTTNSQSQTTTQSPQASVQSLSTGTRSSNVQPGTATNLLNSQGGVALHGTALSTVSLSAAAPVLTPTTTSSVNNPPKHHIKPALLGFPILLFVLAVVLIWLARRSVKNTTQY